MVSLRLPFVLSLLCGKDNCIASILFVDAIHQAADLVQSGPVCSVKEINRYLIGWNNACDDNTGFRIDWASLENLLQDIQGVSNQFDATIASCWQVDGFATMILRLVCPVLVCVNKDSQDICAGILLPQFLATAAGKGADSGTQRVVFSLRLAK